MAMIELGEAVAQRMVVVVRTIVVPLVVTLFVVRVQEVSDLWRMQFLIQKNYNNVKLVLFSSFNFFFLC